MTLSEFYKKLVLPTSFGENSLVYFYERIPNKADKQITEVDIAKINLIVGANNSGKSQISRALLRNQLSISHTVNLNDLITSFQEKLIDFLSTLEDAQNFDNYSIMKGIESMSIGFVLAKKPYTVIRVMDYILRYFDEDEQYRLNYTSGIISSFENLPVYLQKFMLKINELARNEYDMLFNINHKNISRIYFPTLRFLLKVNTRENWDEFLYNHYKFTPKKDTEDGVSISIGIDSKKTVRDFRNSENFNDVDLLYDFQNFLASELFSGRRVMMIAPQENDNAEIKIRIDGEEPRFIYDLGDGIAQIIILFWRLFREKSGFVVIEEIEQNLHPGLQRHVLRILATHERFKNFIFFLPTHSNHLIECYNEFEDRMKVFNVAKRYDENGKVRLGEFYFEDVSEQLGLAMESLQVNNSSVLLSNSTIFVEGFSDVPYYQSYFELFQTAVAEELENLEPEKGKTEIAKKLGLTKICKKLSINPTDIQFAPNIRKHLHYGFLYGAGSNMRNYRVDENDKDQQNPDDTYYYPILDLIVPKLIIFTDSDNKSDDNLLYKRFKNYKDGSRKILEVLEVKEIENTIDVTAIKMNIQLLLKQNKNANLTGKEIPEADHKTKYYLELAHILANNPIDDWRKGIIRNPKEADDGRFIGSLKSDFKRKLAIAATKSMKDRKLTFKDLTPEAKRIALLMFRHILHCNPDLRAGGR